jgi:hypothetical protein
MPQPNGVVPGRSQGLNFSVLGLLNLLNSSAIFAKRYINDSDAIQRYWSTNLSMFGRFGSN